ncbi:MAG: crossover junction endodeoxyribonuclease RuvC [Spirochaetes bacterium]|uniref:Crossover junction endodeoxyribonuclease RuvC n=1 Tax=Candidatus Avitreponema avistercoris TaxID=2840705 RepID=A0A9D9ENM6_9SPIR|nr:crossover junction endodeoxyribonuclease RuvC [Candidatus Avitreponema avistercoris]
MCRTCIPILTSQRDSRPTEPPAAEASGADKDASRFPVRRILGIDPGLASCGYGIIEVCRSRCRLVEYGVIETSAGMSHALRLLSIYKEISRVVESFSPTEAGMEALYFARNVSSALGVAEARGVLSLCLAEHGILPAEYPPNTIKQAVSGTARAGKRSVQEAVRLLLGLREIPRPDHAADALAAAITHMHACPLPVFSGGG